MCLLIFQWYSVPKTFFTILSLTMLRCSKKPQWFLPSTFWEILLTNSQADKQIKPNSNESVTVHGISWLWHAQRFTFWTCFSFDLTYLYSSYHTFSAPVYLSWDRVSRSRPLKDCSSVAAVWFPLSLLIISVMYLKLHH